MLINTTEPWTRHGNGPSTKYPTAPWPVHPVAAFGLGGKESLPSSNFKAPWNGRKTHVFHDESTNGKKIVGLGTLMISCQSQQTLVGKQSNTNFNLITTSFICDYKRVPFSNNRFHFRVSNRNPNHRDPNQPTLTIRSFRHTPGTYPPRPPTGMPDIMLQGYVGVLLDH